MVVPVSSFQVPSIEFGSWVASVFATGSLHETVAINAAASKILTVIWLIEGLQSGKDTGDFLMVNTGKYKSLFPEPKTKGRKTLGRFVTKTV